MKYLKFSFFASFLQLIAASAAYAGAYGLGKTSCAEFAIMYRSNPYRTEQLFFDWAQGFISGMDLYSVFFTKSERLKTGSKFELEPMKLIIREYCDKHPLQLYYMAVLDTYTHLPSSPTAAE